MLRRLLVTATALAGVLAVPQDPVPAPPPQAPALQAPAPPPAAAPADVASVDAIVKAVYDVISGPAGSPRDWNRMRSLFHPDARLVPVVGTGDSKRARLLTVDDYVLRSGPMLERDGFFEREVARTATTFGDIAHVWSTYEGRRTAADATPFLRGINSFQLVRQQGRWFVLQILWQSEADGGPLPAEFLPAK